MDEQKLNEARLTISGFLKQRREELNLTQEQLGLSSNMARETINRMEAGKFWLGMKQFLLICKSLNIDPENILKQINK